MATLNIIVKRPSKVYHEGETIAGVVEVVVGGAGEARHEGLLLVAEGGARVAPQGRPPALLDAIAANVKTIPLVHTALELLPAGRVPPGATAVPFELPLRALPSAVTAAARPLLETYHGVFVSVTYALKATLKRSFLSKPLTATCHFFVQHIPCPLPAPKPVRCEITPASVRASGAAGRGAPLPHFLIYAELHSTVCSLDQPITGKIRVEESASPVKCIELQLVRVETLAAPPHTTRDATEIQNLQVACGDVVRARDIPLHMVLPRLFAAPTAAHHHFAIEFELNIAVVFEDDHLVTENFPILLLRAR